MSNDKTEIRKSTKIPIHWVMGLSFLACLVFVVAVFWEIKNSLTDVKNNSDLIQLETTKTEQDIHALTDKVFPTHRLELSVMRFLHEFEYMLIDTARDDAELSRVSDALRSTILKLPPEATNKLPEEQLNNFNETMGILLDITTELSEVENPRERYQLLYDSKDSIEQFEPMLEQLRVIIEEQGKQGIRLAEASTQQANTYVASQQKQAQDMSVRASILLGMLIVVFLITNSGLYWTISRRLSQVGGYTRQLVAGNFDAHVEFASRDNIGNVAKDVELMGDILANQLMQAERNRKETNRRAWIDESLRELYEATMGKSGIGELSAAIALFLGDKLNLLAGKIYYIDQQNLVNIASYGISHNPEQSFSLHDGLPGLVAKTGLIKIIEDATESGLLVKSAFLRGQPSVVYLIPIMSEGQAKLVLELGCTSLFSEQQRIFLDQASNHIALSVRAAEQQNKTDEAVNQLKINAELLQQGSKELELAKDIAEKASHAKSDFLANMSHEIRTPLNGIIGNTELLLSSDMGQRQQDFTMTIQRSGDALLTIINDILDFSKIEAGKLDLVSIPFDLRVLIEDIGEMFSEQAREKNIELLYNLPPELSLGVIGDPGRLRQVIINLTGNALKFTSDGEVIIRVEAPGNNDSWLFEVKDTGIGISERDQQNIFNAFTQANASSNRQFGGTGLGLAVSKQLVELMNGQLSCSSTPGVGSTFQFTAALPLTDLIAPNDNNALESLAGLRVLLVDDNSTNRDILSNQLAAWDINCTSASCAHDALEILDKAVLDKTSYHLAILDQEMPHMDGVELATLIRSKNPFTDMAIIMLSSVYQESVPTLEQLNISHSLMKPVRSNDLLQYIRSTTGAVVPFVTANHKYRSADLNQNLSKAQVLVVDDSAINRKLAKDMLDQMGHEVAVSSSGASAIVQVKNNTYDLILMDCQMPDMDGFEATRLIRDFELSSNKKASYIAALTANAMVGDRQRCIDAGMDDYLSKPYRQRELLGLLARSLSDDTNPVKDKSINIPDNTASVDNHSSVLDSNQLNEIRSLGNDEDGDILTKLIDLYLNSSPTKLESLASAIRDKDTESIFHLAHALKSDSANLGAVTLSACCQQLEELARSNVIDDADAIFTEIRRHFDATHLALQQEQQKAA